VLLTMLPEYLHRIQAGNSLLMRICGLYHMHTVNDSRPVFFIVAISVFDDRGLGLHHQFDLKGSSAGRLAPHDEAVKKDNNWTKDKMRVNLPADLKRCVAAALEADAHFLARHRVLDYSVLIGIHDRHSLVRGRHNKVPAYVYVFMVVVCACTRVCACVRACVPCCIICECSLTIVAGTVLKREICHEIDGVRVHVFRVFASCRVS